MRMTALYAALSGAFLLGTAALCPAQSHPTPNGMSSAESKRIAAEYKESKARCKSMTGNAKDVCMKEAKGQEKVAKAELDARRKGNTAESDYKVAEAKAKAKYDVEQEKCDDMSGKEKSACKKQAKADEDKALAEAKAMRKNVAMRGTHRATTANGTAPR